MSSFYVRIKPQLVGTNVVHKEGCPFLPDIENTIFLGKSDSSAVALKLAKLYFSNASCCRFCSNDNPEYEIRTDPDWYDKSGPLNISYCLKNN